MASEKKQSVLNGAMMLMFAVVLVKLIGALFKIPLTDMLGATGRGYFNSAYEVYTPIFAISMAGLPVAVSRMVAENVALNRHREARMVFKVSQRIFTVVGIAGTLILLIAAYPYTHFVAGIKSLPAVLCVAPSIFFCCYMSAYRGYYEGLRNMTPTAISQVIEALGKLLIGLALAKLVISIGEGQYEAGMLASGNVSATVFGNTVVSDTEANSVILPWAAAGAVLGVTVGSILSNVFLIICYKIKGDGFTRVELVNSPKSAPSDVLAKNMIKIAVPMVISSLVLNITNLVDTVTIQSRLMAALESDFNAVLQMHGDAFNNAVSLSRLNLNDLKEVRSYLWGSYGMALDFKNLVPTITIQLGVSALPALAAAWAVKDKKATKSTIETVIRIGMLIALPAGIGMAALAEPILTVIYGRGSSSDAISVVTPILVAYGLATPVMAVSTPVTNMLQAIGRTDIPVKSVVVGAICKIVCNFILVGNPKINIYGAVIGTVLFYVVIVACNLISLIRISNVKVRWASVFVKPLICAALCGVTAFAANGLLNKIFPADTSQSILNMGTVSAGIAVVLAVIVYAISLLLIKGIAREDVSVLPKGEKIAKTLEKYGLLG
ncbi:MAG: polysaccharide biosynthesis protein [Acutalibacteraceae bacterium]|nr:polysaccharide biosynthesis protein [Acutalibacteraceae bacterium]